MKNYVRLYIQSINENCNGRKQLYLSRTLKAIFFFTLLIHLSYFYYRSQPPTRNPKQCCGMGRLTTHRIYSKIRRYVLIIIITK